MSALNPAPANAASGMTVRFAPASNAFLFVEVSGSSTQPGASIIQWSFNGGQNQIWTFRPAGTDYEIVNKWSGQCITTDGVAGTFGCGRRRATARAARNGRRTLPR